MRSYKQMLQDLHDAGYTDAQIAVGIGDLSPGPSHPSATSIYRWRVARNRPSPVYLGFLEMYWKQEIGK